MSLADQLELIAVPLAEGAGWQLKSPTVGHYTQAPSAGSSYHAGQTCARLVILNRVFRLVVPAGCGGTVTTAPPGRKHLAVGHGQVLFELHPLNAADTEATESPQSLESAENGLVLRSAQAGRFYHSPDPDSPPFVRVGDQLRAGKTVGLLEVMKTFTPVKYATTAHLPSECTLKAFLCADATDVEEGQSLIEVEAIAGGAPADAG